MRGRKRRRTRRKARQLYKDGKDMNKIGENAERVER